MRLASVEQNLELLDLAEAGTAWCGSSVGRELRFLLSHTVHHFALIAQPLRSHGLEPEPDFGVAPSTPGRWRATAQAG